MIVVDVSWPILACGFLTMINIVTLCVSVCVCVCLCVSVSGQWLIAACTIFTQLTDCITPTASTSPASTGYILSTISGAGTMTYGSAGASFVAPTGITCDATLGYTGTSPTATTCSGVGVAYVLGGCTVHHHVS